MCSVRPGMRSLGLICILPTLVSLLFSLSFAACAEAQKSEAIRRFDLSIGDYFRIPEEEVVFIRQKIIDEEELPVVFFLSARARVHPDVIVGLRMKGYSWMDITRHYRLSPEIYYVPVKKENLHWQEGQPYGNAYGNSRNKKDWKKITFSDREVVDQVNLKFLTQRYNYPPETIIRYRTEGRRFGAIYEQFEKERTNRAQGLR